MKFWRPSGASKVTKDLRAKLNDKPAIVRMTMDMPVDLHTKLKTFASSNRKTIIGVLKELIQSLPEKQ
jgi:hypothetical protein